MNNGLYSVYRGLPLSWSPNWASKLIKLQWWFCLRHISGWYLAVGFRVLGLLDYFQYCHRPDIKICIDEIKHIICVRCDEYSDLILSKNTPVTLTDLGFHLYSPNLKFVEDLLLTLFYFNILLFWLTVTHYSFNLLYFIQKSSSVLNNIWSLFWLIS